MTDLTNIGVAQDLARKAKARYQGLFRFILLLETAAALLILFRADKVLDWLNMSHIGAESWLRVMAGFVLVLTLFQLGGAKNPVHDRRSNIIGIIGRIVMSLIFFGLGGIFIYLAIFEIVTALLLYLTYRRTIISELQTRP